MDKGHPIVLTNFGYQRKGWITPIEALREWFDVRYIHFNNKEAETERYTDAPVYYWDDFNDAYELLNKVNPRFIVFMGLESGTSLALNFAAKKKDISTFYLQHGLYGNFFDYRAIEKIGKKNRKPQIINSLSRSNSSTFIINTFKKHHNYYSLLNVLLYTKLIKYLSSYVRAAKLIRTKVRFPSTYICYSHQNAIIHKQIDGATTSNTKYIGYPEFDIFFDKKNEPHLSLKSYYLLIDQPLAENRFGNIFASEESQIEFYKKMAEFSFQNNRLLKVKLHPESYKCTWLPQIKNIEYLKDVEHIDQVIKNAKGCMGFLSTLTLPAIYFKPTIVFKVHPHSFYNFIEKNEICSIYNFHSFTIANLEFPSKIGSQSKAFTEAYFPFTDGKSIERLRDVFIN